MVYTPAPHTFRTRVQAILTSDLCEGILGLIISLSFYLIILEADYGEASPPNWLNSVNLTLSVFYGLELVVRLFAFGKDFFFEAMNVFDFVVVFLDLLMLVLEAFDFNALRSVGVLRGFRTLRLCRGIKVISRCPSVSLMVKGLVNSASAACFGALLLLVVLSIFSVTSVQLIHPLNERLALDGFFDDCERCPRAFENVHSAIITFIQIMVIGDNWGDIVIPLVEEAPSSALFFTVVFVAVHFTIMNVILAVVVDIALKASQEDLATLVKQKEDEFKQIAEELKVLCKDMDHDGSGDLTEAELCHGYDTSPVFARHMMAMDIKKEDMHVVFAILDSDKSGSVNYEEFITELFKMKRHDSHTLLVFIKHYVTEIRRDVQEQVRVLKQDIMSQMRDIRTTGENMGVSTEQLQSALASSGDKDIRAALSAAGNRSGSKNVPINPDLRPHDTDVVTPLQSDPLQSMMKLTEDFKALRTQISQDMEKNMKDVLQTLSMSFETDLGGPRGRFGGGPTMHRLSVGHPHVRATDTKKPKSVPWGEATQQKSTWASGFCSAPPTRDAEPSAA